MAGRLTDAQVATFRRQGVLILPDFVEPALLDAWRGQFWKRHHAAGARPDQRESWSCIGTEEVDKWMELQPLLGDLPQTRSALAALGGAAFVPGTRAGERTDMMIATLPGTVNHLNADGQTTSTNAKQAGSQQVRQTPHIDGAAKHRGAPGSGLMIGCTTYLYTVDKGGGGFCYWPNT
jgi:hypothetical protein